MQREGGLEPLRMVPATWEIFRAAAGPAAPTIATRPHEEWTNVLAQAVAVLALAIVCLVFPDHLHAHFDLHYLVPLGILMTAIQALLLVLPLVRSRRRRPERAI
jgi:ABC-type enterobactin transport system permease subunit